MGALPPNPGEILAERKIPALKWAGAQALAALSVTSRNRLARVAGVFAALNSVQRGAPDVERAGDTESGSACAMQGGREIGR